MGLSRDEVRALQNADDSVSFYYTTGDGEKSFAVARKRHNPNDGFGDRTIDREIPVGFHHTIYERDGSSGRTSPTACYYSVMTPKFNAEWRTIASLLREGDELVVEWVASNSNDLHRQAGLANDEIKLRITRPHKSEDPRKARRMTFLLDTQTTHTHSPARMVRFS